MKNCFVPKYGMEFKGSSYALDPKAVEKIVGRIEDVYETDDDEIGQSSSETVGGRGILEEADVESEMIQQQQLPNEPLASSPSSIDFTKHAVYAEEEQNEGSVKEKKKEDKLVMQQQREEENRTRTKSQEKK